METQKKPKLAALMTTYNAALYVRQTIESVLNQTFGDFEFIIVDDGSTDETVELIKSYEDSRIKLYARQVNLGVGSSLKEGVNYVTAPYIVKVDSDDLSVSNRFELLVQYFDENPEHDLVKSYFEYFADSDEVYASERFKARLAAAQEINRINTEELITKNIPRWLCIEHTTYCAKTEAVRNAGYPELRLCEDYSLFYRMWEQGCRMSCLPETLVKMRVSNHSITAQLSERDLLSWFTQQYDLKKNKIAALTSKGQRLAIYGCGGLGRLMYKILTENHIKVSHFIEQEARASILVEGESVPVLALHDSLQSKILIAAQPVRLKVVAQLESLGLLEWKDFVVLA